MLLSMKEHLPQREPIKEPSSREGLDRTFRHNRLTRSIRNVGVGIVYLMYLISTDSGREDLRKYGLKDALFAAESRSGLLEDSILSDNLYFPNNDGTLLSWQRAIAGRWIAYDFNRPFEFGEKFRGEIWQKKEGKLWCFPLQEIIDKKSGDYTPTNLLDLFDFNHMRQLTAPSVDELLDWGLIRESTYEEAYLRAGLIDKYRRLMTLEGILDGKVYVVTPKGNGLIGLSHDSGKQEKDPKEKKVLKPRFSF